METQVEPMIQRYWGLKEFAMALVTAGFSDVQVSGGYERGRPVRSSDRTMTFEAVKR